MAEETDGVREAFDDALRIALTVATQLGERVARLREQFARAGEARAVQTNRELEARFEGERGAMRSSLLPLSQEGWWETTSVAEIANARETAVAWRDYDDVARETNATIEREVKGRYGIDIAQAGADPSEVTEALRIAESERVEARENRVREGKELAAADMLLVAAERSDRESERSTNSANTADSNYDSADRREKFAASLVGVAAPATIAARILADGENARHPVEALTRSNGGSANLRRGQIRNPRERERGGLAGR
jgi:hypothetical protein